MKAMLSSRSTLEVSTLLSRRLLGQCRRSCIFFALLLSACQLAPKPFCPSELYQRAQNEICQVFAEQAPLCEEIDFNHAMARGLRYNLDNRVKQTNTAIKLGQMQLAEFEMLPVAGLSGSSYSRNNDDATFSSNPDGTPNRNQIAFGADRKIRSWRAALKWNLIDLGMGYIKTKEAGERVLIAEEEARKDLQKLVQDIRVAYWTAYAAQELKEELQCFHVTLEQFKDMLNKALTDKTIPKEDLLNYQMTLLEENRKLVQLEDRLRKAEFIFKYLINIPACQPIRLKKPPTCLTKIQNLRDLNFEKLDAITLVNRPELRGQGYQQRIAELGTKKAILQALPVVTLNIGRNYNSNSFLVNNFWNDQSIEFSWNIFNLAALPVSLRDAKTQIKFENLKLMALTLGALNETRIAFAHYQNIANEYRVANSQTMSADNLYHHIEHKFSANIASKQQLIYAQIRYIYAKVDELLLVSDVALALGQLYIASGYDVLPLEATHCSSDEVLCIIEKRLKEQECLNFKDYVNITYDKIFCKT